MAASESRFTLTAAIDYSNGEPHLGHAYEKVAADAFARYHRFLGEEIHFVMGTDEHSVNVERAAQARGEAPKAYADRMAQVFEDTWQTLRVGYTVFRQTSDPRHVRSVQHFVKVLYDRGFVYQGVYRGLYCPSCEAFYTEKDLERGECPVHRRLVQELEEPNYFFRLSAFRDQLLEHFTTHPDFCQPESRRNEMLNVLQGGLEDLSISRAGVSWGIPLPWDPDHTVYVWFDALLTYVSALGYPDDPAFPDRWPADLHLIGKDITRFHCLVWPAMLMAAGLPLPRRVFAHGFINLNGERLSKTTGNVVDPIAFARLYGNDAMRYYLLTETPFGQDGNLAPAPFVKRMNSDLANDLGNLLNRSLTMIERFSDGTVPTPPDRAQVPSVLQPVWEASLSAYHRAWEDLRPNEAAEALLVTVRRANKYIDEAAPWRLAKSPDQADPLRRVLHDLAETLRVLAIAYRPFLLDAPGEIGEQLGIGARAVEEARPDDLSFGTRLAGVRVKRGEPLFPRLDAKEVLRTRAGFGQAAEEAAAASSATPAASQTRRAQVDEAAPSGLATASGSTSSAEPGEISIEDVHRLDLRVATIRSALPVEGADRLLRLEIDLGTEERTIVSGIAQHYRQEELVGKQIIVVANLKPASIRGVRSNGMLLAASNEAGLSLLTLDRPMAPGSRAK